jgi:sec-independent protein translocase protein TatC
MLKKKHKNQNLRQQKKSSKPEFLSFAEHLNELRRRLFYVAGAVAVFSTAAYFVQQQLVHWLLLPAHGVQFIYTSPGGGISFLFSVCTYVGIVLSIPVIIYNIVAFIEPVMKAVSKKLVVRLSIASGVLAITGMALGYKFGLPLALHFLTHQFTTKQIKPLFTIQEYMSFVTIYMIGAALMFQVPLILLFINHIKPLKPSKLLHYERHVVVFAFIVSAVMAPTINLIDQLVIAIPIMIIYQVAIV